MKATTALLTVFLVGFFSILACVLIVGGLYVSATNTEVGLRNAFMAKQKANESSFDKMWKTLQQQTGVADHERESFKQTYSQIMQDTKGVAGNGQLASFFTQAKIDVSPGLFEKLMNSIEAQRAMFHQDQEQLLKIKQEHDNVRQKFPSSLFVGYRPALEAKIVTSTRTDQTFASGKDDDVNLYAK